MSVNIMILSCGTRNKIVQYFRQELRGDGLVIATDCSRLAPALYEADEHCVLPRIDDPGYLDTILKLCKDKNIKAVLSLIDPELTLLANNRDAFVKMGVTPIVSDESVVKMCFDKYSMYKFLTSNGFKTARSYVDKDEFYQDVEAGAIDYPVFVKPVRGSASMNINEVTSEQELELLLGRFDNLMIQEYMNGIEYGVDAYMDMISGEPVAIFAKEKIKMRAGETDKSMSVKDSKMLDLINRFVRKAGFRGIIDIDVFKVGSDYYISEVNPRFGGGYPHAWECGVNVPRMIIRNIKGKANKEDIGNYDVGIYMMKFNDIRVLGR